MGYMPAAGELVRCTSGGWMVFPPSRCQAGHRLRPNNVRVVPTPAMRMRRPHHVGVRRIRLRRVQSTARELPTVGRRRSRQINREPGGR